MVLLRPHILGYKNRLLKGSGRRRSAKLEISILVIILVVMVSLYAGLAGMFNALIVRDKIEPGMIRRFLEVFYLGFHGLLLFSNFIAALSCFYASKDLPLILASPVRPSNLYISKLVETMISSSWMLALMGIPAALAAYTSFQLPPIFLLDVAWIALLYALIPAAVSAAAATIFVNFFSLSRAGEVLITSLFLTICMLMTISPELLPESGRAMQETTASFAKGESSISAYLPSNWAAWLTLRYFEPAPIGAGVLTLLLGGTAAAAFLLGHITFKLGFMSGWSRSLEGRKSARMRAMNLSWSDRNILPSKHRAIQAIMAKEARLFFRDPTQALQLVLILLLTFLYLYNFRALRASAPLSEESARWWEAILAVANIFMGASVVSAISTRFVFPSISLEGPAYTMLRVTPLSIKEFLYGKFIAWLLPVTVLSVVLLVSGAMAVQVSPGAILITALLSLAISIGIVGLGIGAGAVYVRFDWESPAQVTSNFGGLVYMLLSVMMIGVTLVPSAFLFVAFSVPGFFPDGQATVPFFVSSGCALFLVFFVNVVSAKRAILAGEQSLLDLEK
jgi:ABC-2 type transport system permease protein